jgi:tetratricopeptide (TPR) repeat protein
MAQPLTVAQRLYRENIGRLTDRAGPMPLDEVRAVLEEARAALPNADVEGRWALWIMIGLAERRLDHVEDALAAYLEALALKPNDPQTALNVGTALGILGKPKEALDHLRRAERNIGRATEMLPFILSNQVAALCHLGEAGEAEAVFERVLAIIPADDAFAWSRAAIAAAVIDRDDDALECFARFLCLVQNVEREGRPAVEVVAAASEVEITRAAQNAALAPTLRAALARAGLPPAPTDDERALAREASRDATGFVDPFALAEALSGPVHGLVSSDDPDARFGRDPQIRWLRRHA